ncbi:MAG: clostripain-related cysteine peptidase [Treponema sp.]|nr:clostripain-related cysteine peptidase [Treponema sp.]MCL2272303.1 clostripain-related cysteine peptidase [Treponema sp.]
MKIILLLPVIAFLFLDCSLEKNIDVQAEVVIEEVKREWTFVIYMAADNDLEGAAITNFNELEAVQYGNAPISILVLLDRSPYYDMTNGNWTDTRLFEVTPDPDGLTSIIKSQRVDCPELGLSKDSETELNTADPMVLSRLIDFAKRVYPAEHYALFIWGHGTGWRSGPSSGTSNTPLKAIAIDDTHGHYMSLPSFGRAVNGKGLSLIGFDTCYGAVLEVAYEVRNNAELFAGSQGAILSTGWDYTTLFNNFLQKPYLSISDLGNSIQYQYSKRYGGLNTATISQIQLSWIENLYNKFNAFSGVVADSITEQDSRDEVLNQILFHVESQYFTSFPSDLYIDILDYTKKITAIRASITSSESQQNAMINSANDLENALKKAVPVSWAQNGTVNKIGVHVIPLQGIGVPAASHELAYIRNSMALDKSAFVENSANWVPNATPQSGSLLDKLFYWNY